MTDLSFSSLELPPAQLSNLEQLGYTSMTAIQAETLPLALGGKDLIAQAKTGSGKTAAFTLPILNKLNPRDFGAQALILCPTRELATQVAGEIRRLARYQDNIKVVTLCGGQSIGPQIGSLEHGGHIIVGTPGRIKDHLRKKTLSIRRVNTLVLDEADRMLEMGFIDDIESIIKETPDARQTLLFSATYPQDIKKLSGRFQKNPVQITVESIHSNQQINQQFYLCTRKEKPEALTRLLHHYSPEATVIFCNTKKETRELAGHLDINGISALALHGDLEQRDRDEVLTRFKLRSSSVLVATDVAARGLDIDELPAVVNYDLPRDADIYVHRIGRTGRAGNEGLAISLFSESENYKVEMIGHFQDREIIPSNIEDLPTTQKTMPLPAFQALCIAGGRKDKVRPGDILGALTGEAGINGKSVGKIVVMDYVAYVAIERSIAGKALSQLQNGKIKGRKFKVRKI